MEPTIQPVQLTPLPVLPPEKNKKKIVLLSLGIIVGFAVILVIWLKFSETDKSTIAPVSEEATVPAVTTDEAITVTKVTTKDSLLRTANGHYLSSPDTENGQRDLLSVESPTLYYDGVVVSTAAMFSDSGRISSVSLSDNGLHYGIVVNHIQVTGPGSFTQTKKYDVYIDGKKVETVNKQIGDVYITNDGKNYFYIASDEIQNKEELVKNGSVVSSTMSEEFSPAIPGYTAAISNNGLNTLLAYGIKQNPISYSVVLNGRQIQTTASSSVSAVPYVALSPSGNHYAVISNGKLSVDGVEKVLNPEILMRDTLLLQVTDAGHYLISYAPESLPDTNDSSGGIKLFVDGKDIPLELTSADSQLDAHINDDASHLILYDDRGWTLDGKKIDLNVSSDKDVSIDMENNQVFVYSSVNQ